MMLRPATPLSIAFLVAFVLLLLATLSTPIIKAIPLGQNGGYNFGVFGYCPQDGQTGECSGIQLGYPTTEVNSPQQSDYSLTPSTRHTLSYILIIHPIAAFMVLICLIGAIAAHFRGPAHSPRFLLALLIFTFPTLLATLLAFLIDILIFIPHPQWGTWIVLPATIIVTAAGVFTCAMRRTLVSRKARKKRIAENEDMNGSNYYAMKQELVNKAAQEPPPPNTHMSYARAESPPPLDMNQANGVATYDKMGGSPYDRSVRPEDDRTPLNPRDPSMRSASTGRRDPNGAYVGRSGSRTRDDDPMGPASPMDRAPRSSSDSRRMRGGPSPPYGRGGPAPMYYDGRGRGRGPGSRGPGRGDYGLSRGGYPPRGGPRGGMRGGPPPGFNSRGGPSMRGRPPPPGYAGGYYSRSPSQGRSPRRSLDEGYRPAPETYDGQGAGPQDRQWLNQDPYAYEQPAGDAYGYDQQQQPPSLARRPSEVTRDPASFGFIGRQPSPARSMSAPRAEAPPPMPSLPAGAGGQGLTVEENSRAQQPSPTYLDDLRNAPTPDVTVHDTYLPMGAYQNEPVELSATNTSPRHTQTIIPGSYHDPLVTRSPTTANEAPPRKSNDFYEDIDPRFSEENRPPLPPQQQQQSEPSHMPAALMPGHSQPQAGYSQPEYAPPHSYEPQQNYPPQGYMQQEYPPSSIYADAQNHDYVPTHPQDGNYLSTSDPNREESQSPAHSDNSNFTSISQRGINPAWQDPSGPSARGPPGQISAARRAQDQVIASNPDFALPGMTSGRRGHQRGMSSGAGAGLGASRYPGT